ncbi:hypothetical protein F8388_003995 [Cannabis sativa]|uniref:Uncharacterized protein n=1 Tax=Cannabis sativa TaxID=3483 RepID=A0A7J6GPJ2_CANSA|nr:hypothetical protein F8388_003995 [Cannabis sativa]
MDLDVFNYSCYLYFCNVLSCKSVEEKCGSEAKEANFFIVGISWAELLDSGVGSGLGWASRGVGVGLLVLAVGGYVLLMKKKRHILTQVKNPNQLEEEEKTRYKRENAIV